MYEMLTGRVPFDADTPVSIALKHMQEKPIEPIKLNPAVPFAVNQIILKAMQKDPNLRYSSATEMLKDLGLALKNPDGNIVVNKDIDTGYTQRIPTLNSERLNSSKLNNEATKKEGYFKKHPKMKIAVIGMSIIVFFIVCILIGYFTMVWSSPKNITVPSITGLTLEQAEKKLKDLKITYEISEEKYSSSVEAGKIISQDPPEGYRILEKNAVKVVVSKGTETTKVPKVAGKTKDEAQTELENAKLQVETIEEISQKIQEGIVIRQDPKENTEVNAGDTVKIYVSKGNGIKQVAVPSVIGTEEQKAKEDLTSQGFEVNVVYEEDKTKTNGIVLKQSLDVGKTVDEGSKITITVNKIAEKKNAKIYVNVKSITGGYTENTSNTSNTTNNITNDEKEIQRTVKVRVEVNGEIVYNKDVDKNITKLSAGEAIGTGTVTIKLFIDDVKKTEKDIDLTQISSYTFD